MSDRMSVPADGADSSDGPDYWNKTIGPFYDSEGLQGWLGLSRKQLKRLAASHRIVELTFEDGDAVYPTYQFGPDGQLLPRVAEIIALLSRHEFIDRWMIAAWLNYPAPEWEGQSAVELLRTDQADEVVLQAGEPERRPLWDRARNAERMALARPILDRFVELVADLPVTVAEDTLFVTRETEVSYGVFAISLKGTRRAVISVHFATNGDSEETARQLAEAIARQKPWERGT
jgi:hypothetical protein